ncbi:MAG: hypothetical protein K6F50_04035 [Kiritimatiellae bacterium]|nr:hypothetical protein [Kiritimatiellia bacterium]
MRTRSTKRAREAAARIAKANGTTTNATKGGLYPPEVEAEISRFAAKRGTTPAEVKARFNRLYTGRSIAPGARRIFTATPAPTDREAQRVERWRKHISDWLAKMSGGHHELGATARAEIERIEGKPLAEIVLEQMKAERGIDPAPAPDSMAAYYRRADEYAEGCCTRSRNVHERDRCQRAVGYVVSTHVRPGLLTPEQEAAWIRSYYRKGDRGTRAAEDRALVAGVRAVMD